MNKYQEALERIRVVGDDLPYKEYDKCIAVIKQALTELEELKKVPTQKQVCKALSEYFNQNTMYLLQAFIFPNNDIHYSGVIAWKNGGNIRFEYDLPHDLAILVGKFFKGVIENE